MADLPTIIHSWLLTFQGSDVLNAALLAVAIVSLLFTARQIVQSKRAQQAAVFKEIYLATFAQATTLEAFSLVEFNKFKASRKDGAKDKTHETPVNTLLAFANCVCAMRELRLMSKRELKTFDYLLLTLRHNREIVKYCLFLQYWETKKTGGVPIRPYHAWVDYCHKEYKLADIYAVGYDITTDTEDDEAGAANKDS